MAIRARFLGHVSGFLVVFASGAFTPVAADSFLLSGITEEATRPPLRDGVMSLDLSVEPSVDEGGSAAAEIGTSQDDTTWHPRAEAFADSSRLAALIPRKAPPSYSVSVNQQVQFFLDRFTRDRREVVDK